MYTKEDILKQLRNGADAADIAKQMADNINAAIQEYDKEQEAAKHTEAEKRKDAGKVVDALNDYFIKYFGEEGVTGEGREKAIDAIIQLTDYMVELEDQMDAIVKKIASKSEDKSTRSDADILRDFLKNL